MYSLLNKRLNTLIDNNLGSFLLDSKTGLEKESLRVSPQGRISQNKHPEVLGAALTHPWITTDYSESLLEFITPPLARAHEALDYLLDIETFVYQKLDDELLWTTSMPCIITGESDIHIAEYGSSNAGMMKTVYRRGLAWRYGKMMQVIAGIHFNHSFPLKFWPAYQEMEGDNSAEQAFINQSYMSMTRNLLRYGWLIPYLFGSSPAICKSFLNGIAMPENMQQLNNNTCYEPYATSLRMGDIGYTNLKEGETGVKANYNSLSEYTQSLRKAITTPCPNYEKIGVKVNGEYRQLNANRLQIENEYYSSVRPKQILENMEKPVDALDQRGIQYVELRSLDINAFHPAGLTHKQLYFLKTFMLFCLLQESPKIDKAEQQEIDRNQSLVAHQGRKPGLKLRRQGKSILLQSWAQELMQNMAPVAELMSNIYDEDCYLDSHELHLNLVRHPELTPSARILEELFTNNESYYEFARRKSLEHRDLFLQRTLDADREQALVDMAKQSIQKQKAMEQADQVDFDTFLERYFKG